MWAFPDCPEWTYPALFLPARKLTLDPGPFVPAALPLVLLLSLPAPLQSVLVAFSSLPALLSAPLLLPFLRASLRQGRHVRSPSSYPAFYRSGLRPRYPSPPATQSEERRGGK